MVVFDQITAADISILKMSHRKQFANLSFFIQYTRLFRSAIPFYLIVTDL